MFNLVHSFCLQTKYSRFVLVHLRPLPRPLCLPLIKFLHTKTNWSSNFEHREASTVTAMTASEREYLKGESFEIVTLVTTLLFVVSR